MEEEMKKRRERIERWRAERKKKELEAIRKDLKSSLCKLITYYFDSELLLLVRGVYSVLTPCYILANIQLPSKKWNLEDDSDEEEESKAQADAAAAATAAADDTEEVDPLDAYMQVRTVN